MIAFENITKSFGNQLLFDHVGFNVNQRERIGLVGRNGHGKTTLFKLITGAEAPDSGKIIIPKNYRIGHVEQKLMFTADTILEEGMTGLREEEKDHFWKVEKVLFGLGFSPEDIKKHPSVLSGGYQVRLNLAKILVSEPDLLLLDEPTNYLDITSIRWIERFLLRWPHELILISHDRSFMDILVTHILGIHRKKIRKYSGTTEKYYSQMAQDEEIYEKTRLKNEKRRKEMKVFISRFRAKARLAGLVQSRIKTLDKIEQFKKMEKTATIDFSFTDHPFPAKQLLEVNRLSFSYPAESGKQPHPIISHFNLHIEKKDRIGIIGKNGIGKTTLLKLLAGILTPQQGDMVAHPLCRMGLFEQSHLNRLDDSKTVEQEILYAHPGMDRRVSRNICGAMMFSGNDALKKISVLSGGEKSRVMLGKLLVTPVNLLLLDEPTNHLDMESCDALLAALDAFSGAVVLVTHNELFLHALAQKLIVFQGDGPFVFDGDYRCFLEKIGWENENQPDRIDSPSGMNSGKTLKEKKPPMKKAEKKRIRSQLIAEKGKVLNPLKKQIKGLENQIDHDEKELAELNRALLDASKENNGAEIADLSRSIHQQRTTIDRLFDELERLMSRYEKKQAFFDHELNSTA